MVSLLCSIFSGNLYFFVSNFLLSPKSYYFSNLGTDMYPNIVSPYSIQPGFQTVFCFPFPTMQETVFFLLHTPGPHSEVFGSHAGRIILFLHLSYQFLPFLCFILFYSHTLKSIFVLITKTAIIWIFLF